MLSRTVISGANSVSWNTVEMPMAWVLLGLEKCGLTSPSQVSVPPSGRSTPDRILISVLLPDPFSPASEWISPGATRRVADRRALVSPNDRDRFSMSRRLATSTVLIRPPLPADSDLGGNLELPAVAAGQQDDEDAEGQLLNRGVEADADEQRGQLGDDQRAHHGPQVPAAAAEQRRAADHHRGDGQEEVRLADRRVGDAAVAGEEDADQGGAQRGDREHHDLHPDGADRGQPGRDGVGPEGVGLPAEPGPVHEEHRQHRGDRPYEDDGR